MKKKSIFGSIVTVILIFVLLGGAVGALWHFSDGFKNWDKFKPNHEQLQQEPKEVAQTIVETSEYGTFTLPKNYIKVNFAGLDLTNGMRVTYLLDEEYEYNAVNLKNNNNFDKNSAKIVVQNTPGVSSYFKLDSCVNNYCSFKDDIIQFQENIDRIDEYISICIIDDNDYKREILGFVYAEQIEIKAEYEDDFLPATAFRTIISDTGVPLTSQIYEKVMSDPNTKITRVYEEE